MSASKLPRGFLYLAGSVLLTYAGGHLLLQWPDDLALIQVARAAQQDPERAARVFAQVVPRDAASASAWGDLGDALAHAGDQTRAEYCFLRGVALAPHSPQIQFIAGDFYFIAHEPRKALPYFRNVLALFANYDASVFNYFGSMHLDVNTILDQGIPDRRAAQSYLRSLMAQKDINGADAAWRWMASRSFGDRSAAAQYAQFLFDQRLLQPAAEVWAEYAKDCSPAYRKTTQVYDGGFECEPAKSPFDWRIGELQGVETLLDRTVSQAGHASLRIRFDGAHNTDFHHVTQSVFLGPGRYVLEAWVRSVDVTTDQGVGLRLVDPQSPARLDVETDKVTGSHEWMKLQRVFTIAESALLELQIVRRPSLRFDNQIGGSVWFDSIVIRPMRMGEGAPSPAP